eukprot:86026-Prymnesium_polylepis.1
MRTPAIVVTFPLRSNSGLRFSGKNMSPHPFWLGGAQSIWYELPFVPPGMQRPHVRSPARSLNFSDVDLPVQLHFALFSGSGGFVVKPPEMVHVNIEDTENPTSPLRRVASGKQSQAARLDDEDAYWPPPRDRLACVTIRVVSLHNLPKVQAAIQTYNAPMCMHWPPPLPGSPCAGYPGSTQSPLA